MSLSQSLPWQGMDVLEIQKAGETGDAPPRRPTPHEPPPAPGKGGSENRIVVRSYSVSQSLKGHWS